MVFGDRVIYQNEGNTYAGVFIKQINQVECVVKLDCQKEKSIINKHFLKFVSNMDNMSLEHALAVADYISKEKYDGHFTLMTFTTNVKFCFGTLDRVNYNTTSLMASGKTIEQAIKKAIDNNIDADLIIEKEERMYK